jgi:hypothetical protein
MKQKILSLIFSMIMALGLTTSSNAIGVEGLGVGISLGNGGYYAVGEEKQDHQHVGVDNTKEAGAFKNDWGSVFIEYGVGPVKFGIDYHIDDIKTPTNTNIQGSTTNTVKATFSNHTTAYILLPIWGGLYVKAGGIFVEIETNEKLGTGGQYGNTDTTGVTAGFGFDKEVQDGFSVRFEALAAQYENVGLTNSNNPTISVDITDMMGAHGKFSVVKTF